MSKMNDARTLLFTNMYKDISKATAEKRDAKGNVEKTIFKGFVKDLFKGVNTLTVTKFLWAVSHRTDALKTPLFRVKYCGKKGYEIERIHSGFVSDETGKKIIGVDLVPYIIAAASLYKTSPRKQKIIEAPIVEAPAVPEQPVAINYASRPVQVELTDEELELRISEYKLSLQQLEQEKVKRDAVKAKKAELLKVFSDMAKDEGFSLEDLMGLV